MAVETVRFANAHLTRQLHCCVSLCGRASCCRWLHFRLKMSIKLSEGALETIMSGGDYQEPIMQILGSKKIQGSGANDRYRLLVSDGKHSHSFAMLATQLNQKLIDGELCDYTVVKIVRFITSVLNNAGKGEKRVMIILDVSVISPGTELGMKIGNPQSWQDGAVSSTPVVPTPQLTRATPAASRSNPIVNNVQNQSAGLQQLSTHMIHPIAGLSPYQNKWVIKVRIMNKSAVRTWSNSKGEGKLFSIDLCDESGEIRATAFKDQCDKFYDMIEVDKMYFISRCQLKTANKQFSRLKNDYEMTFTNDTIVEECTDASGPIPEIQYNFVPIVEIANKEADTIIDVIGICKSSSDVQELVARTTGKQLKKREVTIVDQTNSGVGLTLWGSDAESFDGSQQPVIIVRGARVSEYNGGKSLSVLSSSVMRINPDMSEAHKLRGWFDNGGSQVEVVNMSARSGGGGSSSAEWITFYDAEERQLGSAEKGDYYNVVGVLNYVNSENALYKACPQEQCNKKMIDQENGLYRCEKCNREYPNYKYRIIMSGYISDCTGEQWVTVFNETAESIIGKKAEEIGSALENDKKTYTSMMENVTFKTFLFKIRTKIENFSDEARLKSTIMSAQPLEYKEANARLIKEITSATGIQIR